MTTRVFHRGPVMCYLVFVACATIFVATTAVDPVTVVNESFRPNRKFFGHTATSNEKTREFSVFQRELPFRITSTRDRLTSRSVEKSEDPTTAGTILFSTDKCSRYCIEKDADKNKDNFQYINLFWSANGTDITDYFLPESHRQLVMPEWTDDQNLNNAPENCQIYLDLDCSTTEAGNGTNSMKEAFYPEIRNNKNNFDSTNESGESDLRGVIRMAEKHNLSEHTETKFSVSNTIHRIIINVDGNVSNAALRIPTNATVPWSGTTISWARKGDADGVRIDTRNAPAGEWSVKLTGEDNSKYHITVDGFVRKENDETEEALLLSQPQLNENLNGVPTVKYRLDIKTENNAPFGNDQTLYDFTKAIHSKVMTVEPKDLGRLLGFKQNDTKKVTHERSLEDSFVGAQNQETTTETFNNSDSSPVIYFKKDNEQEEIRARYSIGLAENIDIENIRTTVANNVNIASKMVETYGSQELSEELVNYANENTIEERRMLIDVNRNSNLLVTPGTIHRVVFDVMNSCVLPVRYAFRVKSTPFRIYNIQPTYAWIYPGQMSNVAVDLVIPDNTAPDTANTVTLLIQGTEIKEKSVYLYVQGSLSKLTDDVKPTIEYSFNNNCAGKLEKDRCYKSRWSVDIKIQDYDSGLKRVISSLNEVYPRTEFISGTRSPITFYYSATCCDTAVKITAVDLLDNYNTYTIDVTVWNNLSEAEIAVITVGALLGLLLIILIIILIIYCIKRRKSHDLPYTQRYGSRPPAQAERTNF